ncbi:MAG: BlaI/MecI/CopY family transcriptional regulator [Lachnospiraceae bacterium]|nr:BlaI/MecI/CopY family transcriptional regulator [Lachnospiraceae bacterium]MCX4374663.1 BlaI/MecI/CopY family transcriptional regulator [Lachnospiraceae bacterium]
MGRKKNKYDLPEREVEILYTLWDAGRPLLASEMADEGEELKLATVHTTLKRMLKKGLIEVVDFAKSGNVYGRCYQPTFGLQEFEMERLSNSFNKKRCKDITTSNFVAALLDAKESDEAMEELDELEKMIQEQREKIKAKEKGR